MTLATAGCNQSGEGLGRGLPVAHEALRDQGFIEPGMQGQRACGEAAGHADAQGTGQQLVEQEALGARQLGPSREQGRALLLGRLFAQRQQPVDPVREAALRARAAAGAIEQQRQRLGEIADVRIALLDDHRRKARRLADPGAEQRRCDQPLQPLTAQEIQRPGGVLGRGFGEVGAHGLELGRGCARVVECGVERREALHRMRRLSRRSAAARRRSCPSQPSR